MMKLRIEGMYWKMQRPQAGRALLSSSLNTSTGGSWISLRPRSGILGVKRLVTTDSSVVHSWIFNEQRRKGQCLKTAANSRIKLTCDSGTVSSQIILWFFFRVNVIRHRGVQIESDRWMVHNKDSNQSILIEIQNDFMLSNVAANLTQHGSWLLQLL